MNTFMVGVNTGGQDFYVMLVVECRGFFCSFYQSTTVRRELGNENRGLFSLLKNTEQRLKEDCDSVELCCDTQRAGKGNHVSRAC